MLVVRCAALHGRHFGTAAVATPRFGEPAASPDVRGVYDCFAFAICGSWRGSWGLWICRRRGVCAMFDGHVWIVAGEHSSDSRTDSENINSQV